MTDDDTLAIHANIPEWRRVEGLEYGAHVSRVGWCGKYVRIAGDTQWVIARLTPASDELPGDGTDAEIIAAIRDAIEVAADLRAEYLAEGEELRRRLASRD